MCSESNHYFSDIPIFLLIDSTAATVLAAGLPEQLASLSKTGSISPELLASIPQLSSSASSQALAQVLTQTSTTGASQKGVHDQLSDPAAAAYSKAILIGDFCTAQQLSRGSTPSQQTSMPATANMIGTSIHRAGKKFEVTYDAHSFMKISLNSYQNGS